MTEAPIGGQQRGGHEMLVLLATRTWTLLTGIATQSILARVLAPEGRGLLAICGMFGTLFGTFFALGTDRGAQYQMMAHRQSVSSSTVIGVAMLLLASGIAIALGFPLSSSSLPFFRNADPELLRLSMILIPVTLGVTFLNLQLAGLRRFDKLGVVSVIRASVYLLSLLALVWAFDLGVRGAIFAMAISSAIEATLYLRALHRFDGLRFVVPTRSEVRDVLSYGISYYPARIGTQFDLQASGLFLAAVGTRDEIGFFAVASALALRLFIISDSFEAATLPRIAASPDDRHDLVGFSLRLSGGLTSIAALGLCSITIPLVQLLFSKAFLPAVELIWILAPGIALYSAGKTLMAYFRATNHAGVCSQAIWLGLLVNTGALLWLYPRIGMASAAWSMSAGFLVRSVFLAWRYRSISGVGFAETWLPQSGDGQRILKELGASLDTTSTSRVRIDQGRVVKQQSREHTQSELANSEAGRLLGTRSGSFEVPRILESDPESGTLVFEAIEGVQPLAEVLRRVPLEQAETLVAQAAVALAAIHEERAHGDYSLSNLLFRSRDQRLFVVDWSEAHWLGDFQDGTRADPDLSIFLLSLFYRRPVGAGAIRNPERLARAFVETYSARRREGFDPVRFQSLFPKVLARFARDRAAVRGPLRAALYQPSLWRVARFVKTLKLDTVSGTS